MSVDWSKAPKGATHHVIGSVYPWEKRSGDVWHYYDDDNDEWLHLGDDGDERIITSHLRIVEAPR
jgi:hypothetical protein